MLRRRTPLKRSTKPIARRTPLKRSQKPLKRSPIRRGLSKKWRGKPAIVKYGDRERCNMAKAEGRRQYAYRVEFMFHRQYDPKVGYNRCCNCRQALTLEEATFEHEDGRTKYIDERLYVPYVTPEGHGAAKPLNGVSHGLCNAKRGSQRTPIWHGPMDDEKFSRPVF